MLSANTSVVQASSLIFKDFFAKLQLRPLQYPTIHARSNHAAQKDAGDNGWVRGRHNWHGGYGKDVRAKAFRGWLEVNLPSAVRSLG